MRNSREKSRGSDTSLRRPRHRIAMSLPFAPLIHPVVDRFVPKPRVLRLKHPMAFIWEIQHLGRNPQSLQSREELKSFAYVEPIIVLSVNHQRRRFEFVSKHVR